LGQALAMGGELSGRDFCRPALGEPIDMVVSAPARPVPAAAVATGPRVGVSGPGGDGTAYPWRFFLAGDRFVSDYRPGVVRRRRVTAQGG